MFKDKVKRTIVNADDCRAALMAAKGRDKREVKEVPHEVFIRRFLKERLGIPHTDPASDSIKEAAARLAKSFPAAPVVVVTVKTAEKEAVTA